MTTLQGIRGRLDRLAEGARHRGRRPRHTGRSSVDYLDHTRLQKGWPPRRHGDLDLWQRQWRGHDRQQAPGSARRHRLRPDICLAREHNNANVLCLPARYLAISDALDCVATFLDTEFEGGRHARRVDKIACS